MYEYQFATGPSYAMTKDFDMIGSSPRAEAIVALYVIRNCAGSTDPSYFGSWIGL